MDESTIERTTAEDAWFPGELMQTYWTRLLPAATGLPKRIDLLVAALPYSDYTFVRASLDMSMLSWLEHHRAMFESLGGVPLFLAPDNCPAASTFDRTKAPDEDGYRKVNRRSKVGRACPCCGCRSK